MLEKDKYRLIAVRGGEKYLVTHLMADTEYTIAVQGFTSSGTGPLSQSKMARTSKVPTVTGIINTFHSTLKILTLFTNCHRSGFSYQLREFNAPSK